MGIANGVCVCCERRPEYAVSYREQIVCCEVRCYASGVCSAEVVAEVSAAPGGEIFLTVPLLPLRAERRRLLKTSLDVGARELGVGDRVAAPRLRRWLLPTHEETTVVVTAVIFIALDGVVAIVTSWVVQGSIKLVV